MTEQQAKTIANDLQALRAKMKAAWSDADQFDEVSLQDAIDFLDLAEESLAEAGLIPVVPSAE